MNPFKGKGKPEPSKENFKGFWAVESQENTGLIYKAEAETIIIVSCAMD